MVLTTGGAGTNAAITFARQGFSVASVVRVGDDLNGKEVIEEFKKERINGTYVQIDKKLQTAYSVILIAPTGERTILVHRGANMNLNARQIPWGKFKPTWVYLNSLSGDMSILDGVLRLKKRTGCFIAWNPGGKDLELGVVKLQKYLKYIDVFIVNQEEASGLVGVPYKDEKMLFRRLDELVPGLAIMTKGPAGVTVSNGKQLWVGGIYKEKEIVDRTGAGDAFCSGFVSALTKRYKKKKTKGAFKDIFSHDDIVYAIKLGSANGTSVVENIGAKAGILTAKDFKNKRWNKLAIRTINLS
jgi:ribokinase